MSTSLPPLDFDSLRDLLPPRTRDSHKGTCGHVLLIGGEAGKGGAALLAAEAALRCGAGLVSVATHNSHAATFLARRPELMVSGIEKPDVINVLVSRANVLVAGPGLGRGLWGEELLRLALHAAASRQLPVIMDADALNLLAEDRLGDCRGDSDRWILTPHPGEAARLLKITNAEVQADRNAAARMLLNLGAVALLKGSGTVVSTKQEGEVRLETCSHGNPGMASGGMGDVLTGVIAALLAQGLSLADSARLGVCLHSKAADLCAEAGGMRGMLASDLYPFLRSLLNS